MPRPKTGKGARVIDADRTGGVPQAPAASSGGSVYASPSSILTEGAFIQYPKPTFVDSPFGQRYVADKAKPMLQLDTLVRVIHTAFTAKGYATYGTVTSHVQGITDTSQVLSDWYGLVRDMGKRNLKYKHLPTTLSDTTWLLDYLNVYHYWASNTWMLLNLNRLPMYNQGFATLTSYLPKYMSRISRLWRRGSALRMSPLLKGAAIRDGGILSNVECAPTIRIHTPFFLRAAGSGGPTLTGIAAQGVSVLAVDANLATLVANLEAAERWLEVGNASDDFIAMKDLIDMTVDIVPGTWETGLPKGEDAPGLVSDWTVFNDLFLRAELTKDIVTAGTDRWIIFPTAEMTQYGFGRIPILGRGTPNAIYDFTLFGSPKFAYFEADKASHAENVDTDVVIPGTNFWLTDIGAAASQDIRNVFGVKSGDGVRESLIVVGGGAETYFDAFDVNTASAVRIFEEDDTLRRKHYLKSLRYHDRDSFPGSDLEREVVESRHDYLFYAEAEDFGWNNALLWAQALGIPYFK